VPNRYLAIIGTQSDHPGVGAGPGARRRRARVLHELLMTLEGHHAALTHSSERSSRTPADRFDRISRRSARHRQNAPVASEQLLSE
jgi:hypothetical protein